MKQRSTGSRILRNLLLDILITMIALVIFALFHHVLPRQMTSTGIVIENPYKRPSSTDGSSVLPEGTVLLADSGVQSDVHFQDASALTAASGRNRRSSQGGKQQVPSGKGGSR